MTSIKIKSGGEILFQLHEFYIVTAGVNKENNQSAEEMSSKCIMEMEYEYHFQTQITLHKIESWI